MLKKQNGMTLVEVLATLLLSSLFIILIWTTVAISMKYNLVESKKLQMQQEVNYIITDLQNIHRQSKYECYQIKEENGMWKVVDCLSGNTISTYYNPKYMYEFWDYPDKIYMKPQIRDEAKNHYFPSYSLTVKVSDAHNERQFIEITTVISRFDEKRK